MRYLALTVLLLASPIAAQEPTPPVFNLEPVTPANSEPITSPSVEEVGGAPVAIVPAPAEVPAGLVADVAEQTAENFESVATGEVAHEEIARDPAKTADPGADMVFPLLLAFAAAVAKYVIGEAVRRHPTLSNSLIGLISHGIVLAVVALGFFVLHRVSPDLPQNIWMWIASSGLGQVLGGMANSAKAVQLYRVNGGAAVGAGE